MKDRWTKEDIIKGLEMPGRKCWNHEDRTEACSSPGRPKGKVGTKFPLEEMKVGDCFVAGEYSAIRQQRVIGQVSKYQQMWLPKAKFISRRVKNKLIVWKIK